MYKLVVGLSTIRDMTKLFVVLYSLNNATGIHDGYWAFNFTLTFGTGNDCYMRLDQPLRGLHKGIESEHFIVADAVSPSLFWQQNGSTPLDPSGKQSTYGSASSPALSLPTDGDATQFPDQCLALDKHFEAGCWSALQLSDWIPEGVKANTPCAIDASCQTTNSTIPPWTQAFLASSDWGSNRGCWYIGFGSCTDSVYMAPRTAENRQDRLLFSRYAYTSYTIYCKFRS